jgi:hypothetical protein
MLREKRNFRAAWRLSTALRATSQVTEVNDQNSIITCVDAAVAVTGGALSWKISFRGFGRKEIAKNFNLG